MYDVLTYRTENTSFNIFDQINSQVIRDKSKTMGENYRCHAGLVQNTR